MDNGLHRWSAALGLLAFAGIAFTIYSIGFGLLSSNFKFGFETESGVSVLTADDFTFPQRLTVVGIGSMADVCWAWSMLQILFLSRLFSKGELLTVNVIMHLRSFGLGLFAMGLSDAMFFPTMSYYLVAIKKMDPIINPLTSILGSGMLSSLMAGLLVMILTRIFQIGIKLREDAELTI